MAATLVGRYSFPKVPGDTNWSQADVDGPSSYVSITPGNPPTGGQHLRAADLGLVLGSLTFVWAMGSSDGRYSVTIFPIGPEKGSSFTDFRVMWKEADGGDEVAGGTNLSAHRVRFFGLGA